MNNPVGNDAPCSCAAGKRQDDGLLSVQSIAAGGYRFEPGCYGDAGSFMPSLACRKRGGGGQWEYHYMLVKPRSVHFHDAQAVAEAQADVVAACGAADALSDGAELAIGLRQLGYFSVDRCRAAADDDF